MTDSTSTFDPARHPREQAGQFAEIIKPAPAAAVIHDFTRDNVLGEAPEWKGGGTTVGVQVIESPVSDREINYHLTFDEPRGGYVYVSPSLFGIVDPEREDRDWDNVNRLTVSRQTGEVPGTLTTRFDAPVRDIEFGELVDHLSEDELKIVEREIRQELRSRVGRGADIIFGTEARWGAVEILYTKTFDGSTSPATIDPDGRTTVTTSNLMPQLEEDAGYRLVLDGYADQMIFEVLGRHGIDVG